MTEFDEIAVGVAQVDALHRTAAAVTRDGAELDARTFCQELLLHLLDILVHDKAEVQAAALRMARRRQELRRSLVDIDLRRAKEQRISPLPSDLPSSAQYDRVLQFSYHRLLSKKPSHLSLPFYAIHRQSAIKKSHGNAIALFDGYSSGIIR